MIIIVKFIISYLLSSSKALHFKGKQQTTNYKLNLTLSNVADTVKMWQFPRSHTQRLFQVILNDYPETICKGIFSSANFYEQDIKVISSRFI